MTQRISWLAATTPRVAAYQLLYSDAGADAAFDPLTPLIANIQAGPNWDPSESCFFYDDADHPFRLYRLVAVDSFGTQFETAGQPPFSAGNDPVRAPVPETFPIDHNTGGVDALRYVTPNGDPIENATIRVYDKAKWDAKLYAQVVGLVKTDADGRWLQPVLVPPGTTYVIQAQLPGTWGPNLVEVVV
jgi:hypothetical protein